MQHATYIGRRLSLTAKAVRAFADQQMAAAGSSLTAAIVTRVLSDTPGLAQRELAEQLGVEGPTMVRHLDRLERDGVVIRIRDDADRRIVRVSLTDRGNALRDRLHAVSAHTNEQLVSVFDADELARFEEYLDRAAAHATALLDERRSRPA